MMARGTRLFPAVLSLACYAHASFLRSSEALGGRRRYGNSVSVSRSRRRLAEEEPEIPWPQKPEGDDNCPCLERERLLEIYEEGEVDLGIILAEDMVPTNLSSAPDLYGSGCDAHSLQESACRQSPHCNAFPPPPDCKDKSWCQRFWCYVDARNCSLRFSPTNYFQKENSALPVLHYSYATCGQMDVFTQRNLVQDINNLQLKTGFNSNTGGWMGSYNPEGHFALDMNQWTGPMVEFIKDAAQEGNFSILPSAPPAWIVNESAAFWGRSSFNLCVYAVSLGYLDLCVSDLTITPQRSAVTPFFELDSVPIYLLTFLEVDNLSNWEQFLEQVYVIFQPFDQAAWLFIFLFCVPTMGLLMLFQEHDSPGTAFSERKDYRVLKQREGAANRSLGPDYELKIENRHNPMWRQSVKAVYIAFLAFFIRSYRVRVFTAGGKLQLLAIMCFILLTTTVYTANLAAQFVQDAQRTPVHNLQEALAQGYNFCSERRAGDIVTNLFGIDRHRLVVDPVSEGGDGLPGFACPGCAARRRVFDFMRQQPPIGSDPDAVYCNAAFVLEEDLEVLQNDGAHCNKTIVGPALTRSHRGFALNEDIADVVTSHFYTLKYNGKLEEHYNAAQPLGNCPKDNKANRNKQRLTIKEMSGIWVVAYGFAVAGLLAKAIQKLRDPYMKEHKVMCVDQWGNAMPNPKAMEKLENDVRRTVGPTEHPSLSSHLSSRFARNPRLAQMIDQCQHVDNLDVD